MVFKKKLNLIKYKNEYIIFAVKFGKILFI